MKWASTMAFMTDTSVGARLPRASSDDHPGRQGRSPSLGVIPIIGGVADSRRVVGADDGSFGRLAGGRSRHRRVSIGYGISCWRPEEEGEADPTPLPTPILSRDGIEDLVAFRSERGLRGEGAEWVCGWVGIARACGRGEGGGVSEWVACVSPGR